MARRSWYLTRLCLLALATSAASGGVARAQVAWREGFETPAASWREVGSDVRYKLELHERTQRGARSGAGCEFFQFVATNNGTHIHLAQDIGRAPVIPELLPSVWVRSDRAGVQLLARVVLPRTVDPRSGQPATTLILGNNYTHVGNYEHLTIENIPTLVARQARLLRAQLRAEVDEREAYIDLLMLNVYSGPGRWQMWVDDLEVAGVLESPPGQAAGITPISDARSRALPAADPVQRMTVELSGSTLLAEGRPLFPRMIEYRGESLAFLRERGFNVVRFAELPPSDVLAEAARLRLWIVCPPPRVPNGDEASVLPPTIPDIGPEYNPVLAWDLGTGLTESDLPGTRRWSEQVRRADRQVARPILCDADALVRDYSRTVDVLMTHRYPLGTSCELTDYGTWLRERPRLARPGTPTWTTVQTQYAPETIQQWQMLSAGRVQTAAASSEQVRLLVYAALAAGARGICFQSYSPLDAPDPASRRRATMLELLNLELGLIEAWAAAGNLGAIVPGSVPDVDGVVFQTDRGRLLLPRWSAKGAQYVPPQSAGNGISFVVPGVPESNNVYEITPGGLRPLRRQRVTGGVRATLDEFGMTSMICITQDPFVVNDLTRRLNETGRRATQLQRELMEDKWGGATETDQQLSAMGHVVPRTTEWMSAARSHLQQADARAAAGDDRDAYVLVRRAQRPISLLERAQWEMAVKPLASPTGHPLAVAFHTLPEQWQFTTGLTGRRWGRSRLPAGAMEDLGAMVAAGWTQQRRSPPGVRIAAELSPEVKVPPGRFSLHIGAQATTEQAAGALVEAPLLVVTSPGVMVEAGELVRIGGWVQVPDGITGSLDGLMIVDSLGGEGLAERVGQATTWRTFELIRAAPRSGPVTVSFQLTGLGEAWIDDVTIAPLLPPGAPPDAMLGPETVPPGARPAEVLPPGSLPGITIPAGTVIGPRR